MLKLKKYTVISAFELLAFCERVNARIVSTNTCLVKHWTSTFIAIQRNILSEISRREFLYNIFLTLYFQRRDFF